MSTTLVSFIQIQILKNLGNGVHWQPLINTQSSSTKTLSVRKYRQRESKWIDILQNWDDFFRKNPLDVCQVRFILF